MAFDGIAVSVIVDELNQSLLNARVNKIYQKDKLTLVINLRIPGETKILLISADPRFPRIYMPNSDSEFKYPYTPPAFCMLLRKYLEPSRIISISQHQLERIITITFECYDPELGNNKKQLIFELMGRHSNIILVDHNQIILDAIKRSGNREHMRQIMPGLKYEIPFAQVKQDPREHSKAEFVDAIRLLPGNISISKGLMQLYQGLGPETAKEIIRRSSLDPDTPKIQVQIDEYDKLWGSFSAFLRNPGKPVLILEPKSDFFAYPLSDGRGQKQYADFNNLLTDFYTDKIHNENLRSVINNLLRGLKVHQDRLTRKGNILRKTLEQASKASTWQKLGQLLLTNMHLAKKGDSYLEVVDYYQPEQPRLTIELNPRLTPSENSQQYFKKYSKAKRSQSIVKGQLYKTIQERNYIEETMFHIEQAESISVLSEIKRELIESGYISPKANKNQGKQLKPATQTKFERYLSSDNIEILLGRNNRQNDYVTFKMAQGNHIWMHAQQIPGSHVIIRADNQVPEQTLVEGATLAAFHSKAKSSPKVVVDYTQRKNVRKPRGAKPGFVLYDQFNSLVVDPTNTANLPKKQ